jgi:type IV secretion system protein TrbL
MNDLSVIDQFLNVFSRYIDSGFGLLRGEVAFLTATLVVIDMTLAGLFWAMGGEEVLTKLIKKTLYVGVFAYIIGNFNSLAGIIFRSFAGLGLIASGSGMSQAQLLQPGRLAAVGVTAGQPILQQIGQLSGFTNVFLNLDSIVVLFIAYLVVIVSFFVLAVQLFVTLLEFKLTTLAGFVLVPFALWNKSAFLAERVLGNVMSSGIKVLVLAVIVGMGSTVFSQFQVPVAAGPSLSNALAIMLGALALLGLGIFGPGIATGLVSGAPQLGVGAAAGTALGVAGLAVAGGAAVATGGAAVAAGTRLAARGAVGTVRSASRIGQGAASAYRAGVAASGASGAQAVGAGVVNAARSGAQAAGQRVAAGARAVKDRVVSAVGGGTASDSAAEASAESSASSDDAQAPDWAQRLQRNQRLAQGASTAAHVVRSADHGGGGASPNLRDSSNE